MTKVHIIGSGVAGLCCAYTLLQAGCSVELTTASNGPDQDCCSWWAGGMLAPYCEAESAEPLIIQLGLASMAFWQSLAKVSALNYSTNGTMVIASPRDQRLLNSFARQTTDFHRINQTEIANLEPSLAPFSSALFYPNEAHIEPRLAIKTLWDQCISNGMTTNSNVTLTEKQIGHLSTRVDWLIDCRGLASHQTESDLRGVKGEMLHIFSPEVELHRPIRLLHPRYPLYIVPRPNQQFMVGATMIEANYSKAATVRSVLELLSAAYAVHPAFAEAEIVEVGVDIRPAYDDNLPKIRRFGNRLSVNGLFRHGFLAAPALARRASDLIINNHICPEVVDANFPEWPSHQNAAKHA